MFSHEIFVSFNSPFVDSRDINSNPRSQYLRIVCWTDLLPLLVLEWHIFDLALEN